ncbi:hypothetical protein [Bradyrhizobium iriomotense]|uniref:hypothetical protein n=1 Tax=Bradyrhizobium iriomotense TaxID=441950 RepID=UPI001B89EDB5|nr:hypothetical protein [Bradyrhizobium iriomotense]MBR0781118.1 hypothetical protein [Bradyrhizobium iriomotense]
MNIGASLGLLVAIRGTCDTDGTQCRTEVESFSKIVSPGTGNSATSLTAWCGQQLCDPENLHLILRASGAVSACFASLSIRLRRNIPLYRNSDLSYVLPIPAHS